eukprot:jgi/Bigna1/72358/fgenesh1_pg.19_\
MTDGFGVRGPALYLVMVATGLYLSNILISTTDVFEAQDIHSLIGPEAGYLSPKDDASSDEVSIPEDLARMDEEADKGPVPTPAPTPAPERWKPECDRWTAFRSEIYKPAKAAPSILARPEPCNGSCVAVCICGSLRTFFEPKVSNSIVGTLINGFNPGGRTDVFMVVSEEHSAKGGVHVIPKADQCSIYGKMNIVAVDYMQAPDGPKTDRCRGLIEEVERQNKKQYDWVMRPRPDSYWKQMNLKASTAPKMVYYRHNQFTLLPRQFLHNFKWPFRGTPELEVDVNRKPDNKLEFYIWRTSRVLGLKFRYYESTCMYMVPVFCGPCGRGNKEQPGPAFRLIDRARRDPKAAKRLRDCLHGVFSVACHQLRHHFKSIEPPPQNTPVDVKHIMQYIGDLAETGQGSLDVVGNLLNAAQDKLRGELMVPDDAPHGWMPSLQRGCAMECKSSYNYTKGPWTWGCLTPKLKNSLAMSWHPPGFAEEEPGALGECDPY